MTHTLPPALQAVALCAATDAPAPGLSLARTVAALRLPSFRMAKSLARLMSSRSRKGPRQWRHGKAAAC
ncbi:hypothetical protein HaLaN_19315 [Haematococcus lacustris]|uniref:Uncharacterized protein n=1 Tax=Haematococcus lacustris TaxID=44745 RepID=A0A699ZTC8_HAELA|nr:hypothetical protein HaLaN_19315 [Haematococcus lacustris]